jgi:hypothetical protein
LCEAWLGVKLYLDLWRYFYSTTYYARNLAIGSVGFSLRTENNYITFLIKTSWKGYQRKWFYIQLYEESSIKVRALMHVTNERWRSISLSPRRCRSILHVSKELWTAGLTTAHVVETFVRWRIVPLKQRDLAYTYKGICDPNRDSTEG